MGISQLSRGKKACDSQKMMWHLPMQSRLRWKWVWRGLEAQITDIHSTPGQDDGYICCVQSNDDKKRLRPKRERKEWRKPWRYIWWLQVDDQNWLNETSRQEEWWRKTSPLDNTDWESSSKTFHPMWTPRPTSKLRLKRPPRLMSNPRKRSRLRPRPETKRPTLIPALIPNCTDTWTVEQTSRMAPTGISQSFTWVSLGPPD